MRPSSRNPRARSGAVRPAILLVLAMAACGFAARHLFILAGQSNMAGEPAWAGQGFPDSLPEIRAWNGYGGYSGRWMALRPGMASDSDRFGPEMTLATTLLAALPSDTFAFIKVGYGGTAMADKWLPPSRGGPGPRYATFLQLVAQARGPTHPVDTVGTDSLPSDTTWTDSIPSDTAIGDSLPTDSIPQDTVFVDTLPVDTSLVDTAVSDTTGGIGPPVDTTAVDSLPAGDSTMTDPAPTDSLPPDSSGGDTTGAGTDTTTVDTTVVPSPVVDFPLDGFFWMQGESDALVDTSASRYHDNLLAFVQDVRTALGDSGMPWVIGLIDSQPVWIHADTVREAQRRVCGELEHLDWIETVGLASDGIHFTADGQKELGRRMAVKWLEMKGLRSTTTAVADGGPIRAGIDPRSRVREVDAQGRFGPWMEFERWRHARDASTLRRGVSILEVVDTRGRHRFARLPPLLR